MIDPRSQYIIYQEQENERMLQIERKLAAQEQAGYVPTGQPWYLAAAQWLKLNVFSRRPAKSPRIAVESPRLDWNG